jgi:hypothetical protein
MPTLVRAGVNTFGPNPSKHTYLQVLGSVIELSALPAILHTCALIRLAWNGH